MQVKPQPRLTYPHTSIFKRLENMGSTSHTKQVWQDVVTEKRRVRAESINAFEKGNESSKLQDNKLKFAIDDAASMGGGDVVASLTRNEFSCEDLIKSHIHEFVSPWLSITR